MKIDSGMTAEIFDRLPAGLAVADCPELRATTRWLEEVVIDLNFCPFAGNVWGRNRVLLASLSGGDEQCLVTVVELLELMKVDPLPETALLVLPEKYNDFDVYLDFLALATDLCAEQGFEGDFQLASFHPQYCFDGCSPEDASNYTNRSPYPLLHLLREDAISKVVSSVEDTALIPQKNVELTRIMGVEKLKSLLEGCFEN